MHACVLHRSHQVKHIQHNFKTFSLPAALCEEKTTPWAEIWIKSSWFCH